ncbi:hypothetical protein [Amedibacillus sp. YH-ame10]
MIKRVLGGLLCVGILIGFHFFFQANNVDVKITMNDKEYTMLETTLDEFMKDGYSLAEITYTDKGVELNRYNGRYLEGRTIYHYGVPLRLKGASKQSNASIIANLFNPKEEGVELKEGVITSLTCDMKLLKEDVRIEVAGLQIESQNRKELLGWMDENLKGFKKDEGTKPSVFHYQRDLSSYTFVFDENDIIKRVIASKYPSYDYDAN